MDFNVLGIVILCCLQLDSCRVFTCVFVEFVYLFGLY